MIIAGPPQDEWELRVKHGGEHSSIFYRNNPLVSVGWKGDLFPYKLNIRDIIPITSDRIHVAPSAWCTLQASGFAVITFVPQVAVADLNAEELPSYHRNVDNDESVFVHHDVSSSRRPGTLSHVPQGILQAQMRPRAQRSRSVAARGCDAHCAGLASTRTGLLPCRRLSSGSPANYTVATGVAGDPTAPGKRSGGPVNRKRLRLLARSQSANSVR